MQSDIDATIAKFALEPHLIEIAGRRFDILAVRNQDALLAASDSLEHPPYGLLLWESAVALAKVVARRGRSGLEGRRVLELGCGIGLPGFVAASLGANVTLTDYLPVAIEIAGENARRNGFAVATQLADWRAWGSEDRFDLVIGADIAYETEMHPELQEVLSRSVEECGEILLADPNREQGAIFVRRLTTTGHRAQSETFIELDTAGRPSVPPVTVNVHTIRPPQRN